jgi:hypothetical protein
MTLNALVKELCKREGLKSQTSIGNVREIVGHFADILYFDWLSSPKPGLESVYNYLLESGAKRAKKKPKKKK